MFDIMQILGLTIAMFLMSYDTYHTQLLVYGRTVTCGFIAGVIMGDITTGLVIGGTLELMSLGVGGYGGSSVPNYSIGAIMGTAFAAVGGGAIENGLAVGIPVAALGVQLDVFAKMAGSYILHKAQSCAEKLDLKGMYRWIKIGILPRTAFSAIAVLIAMTAGADVIQSLLIMMPTWLSSGLNIAGRILPAVGFAILLRYMPLKKYFVFSILGFVLASYLAVPIMGVALVGFVAAYLIYIQNEKDTSRTLVSAIAEGDNYDE
ncbi:MAG: PTS sugar transporter subunit IIC [Anaerorhabdus sp.]